MILRATLCAICALTFILNASAASLTAVTPLQGHSATKLFGVSADGEVVAGRSRLANGFGYTWPVRWTAATGKQALQNSPGDANGVSGDGNYIVGHTGDDHSFRWSEAGDIEIIGRAFAFAASYDGSVVVGNTIGPDRRAFRWSEIDGFQDIGNSQGLGVSADGSIVVGQTTKPSGGFYRWTDETGSVEIGDGIAHAISGDGSTIIVGGANGAFHWTETDGIQIHQIGKALAVNFDGSVIVGEEGTGPTHYAYTYRDDLGSRDISQLLKCQGANVTGWSLVEATGVSSDGLTIVGNGTDPAGNRSGWVAQLDPIAHPGDADRNGKVDINDLNLVRNNFGSEGAPVLGDTNYDCGVGVDDLNAVRNNFGWVEAAAVPEPSATILALISIAFTLGCNSSNSLRTSFRHRSLGACVVLLTVVSCGATRSFASYTFTPVAVRAGNIAGFPGMQPSISDNGAVVFNVYEPNGEYSVFLAENGGVSKLPFTNVRNPLFSSSPAINASGQIVCVAEPRFGISELMLYNPDGSVETLDFGTSGYFPQGIADLNDSGDVVYMRSVGSGSLKIVKRHAGQELTIVSTSMPEFSRLSSNNVPSIDESGEVPFYTSSGSIFVGVGGEQNRSEYRLDIPLPQSNSPRSLALSDLGEIAISSPESLMRWDGTAFEVFANTSDAFDNFGPLMINRSGSIGFYAGMDDFTQGIFLANGDQVDAVVRTGDMLTGSTVRSLSFGRHGLNNRGEIAFWALLDDGTDGIFVASPAQAFRFGDTNADGRVNLADLINVRNNFGGSGLGDTDGDGIVGIADLNAVRNNFGAANPVPGPPSLLLLAAGVAGLAVLWRRRAKHEQDGDGVIE